MKAQKAQEMFARFLMLTAFLLITVAMLCGCSTTSKFKKITGFAKKITKKPQTAQAQKEAQPRKSAKRNKKTVVNVNNANVAKMNKATTPVAMSSVTWQGQPVDIPSPELSNINIYARALEKKLQQRYNNTPGYAGRIAKVQLLPTGKPQVSLDGRKMRIEWSQVVFDQWGDRVGDLEKEYYVVVFGDGKPVMQRTRPSITVGMNNEGGFSEFDKVRGGVFSSVHPKADPGMFDRADSEKNSLLDNNLESKNSSPLPLYSFDLPEVSNVETVDKNIPVIKPVTENLQAVAVPSKNGHF